jgi:hypothetical protein
MGGLKKDPPVAFSSRSNSLRFNEEPIASECERLLTPFRIVSARNFFALIHPFPLSEMIATSNNGYNRRTYNGCE